MWWRRGESNPRPQVLCHWLYMLIRFFDLTLYYPIEGEGKTRFQYFFSALTLNKSPSRFYESDAGVWTHRHVSSPTAILLVIKQRLRSCRRLQLYICRKFYEIVYILDMHLRFRNPRRSQVVPWIFSDSN